MLMNTMFNTEQLQAGIQQQDDNGSDDSIPIEPVRNTAMRNIHKTSAKGHQPANDDSSKNISRECKIPKTEQRNKINHAYIINENQRLRKLNTSEVIYNGIPTFYIKSHNSPINTISRCRKDNKSIIKKEANGKINIYQLIKAIQTENETKQIRDLNYHIFICYINYVFRKYNNNQTSIVFPLNVIHRDLLDKRSLCHLSSILNCLYAQKPFVEFIAETAKHLSIEIRKNTLIGNIDALYKKTLFEIQSTINFNVFIDLYKNGSESVDNLHKNQDPPDFFKRFFGKIKDELASNFEDNLCEKQKSFNTIFEGQIFVTEGEKNSSNPTQYIFYERKFVYITSLDNMIQVDYLDFREKLSLQIKIKNECKDNIPPKCIILSFKCDTSNKPNDLEKLIASRFSYKDISNIYSDASESDDDIIIYKLNAFIYKYDNVDEDHGYYSCYCIEYNKWYCYKGLQKNPFGEEVDNYREFTKKNIYITTLFYYKMCVDQE